MARKKKRKVSDPNANFVPLRLPGKYRGTLDLKLLEKVIIQVRDERLAHEAALAASAGRK